MKTIVGTLLLTFVVLLISSEVSSLSSGNDGRGEPGRPGRPARPGRGGRRDRVDAIGNFQLPNKPAGHTIILPNGNTYISNGGGPMNMRYDVSRNTIRVSQGGLHVVLEAGPLNPLRFRNGPNLTVVGIRLTSVGPQPPPNSKFL